MALADVFDAAMDRFDDIVDRMRYHTIGEQPPDDWDNQYHCFYGQELEIDLAYSLAKEMTYRIDETLTGHRALSSTEDLNLIQPVEYKIILPEPLVPVHRAFITEITPEDLRRWNSG